MFINLISHNAPFYLGIQRRFKAAIMTSHPPCRAVAISLPSEHTHRTAPLPILQLARCPRPLGLRGELAPLGAAPGAVSAPRGAIRRRLPARLPAVRRPPSAPRAAPPPGSAAASIQRRRNVTEPARRSPGLKIPDAWCRHRPRPAAGQGSAAGFDVPS